MVNRNYLKLFGYYDHSRLCFDPQCLADGEKVFRLCDRLFSSLLAFTLRTFPE